MPVFSFLNTPDFDSLSLQIAAKYTHVKAVVAPFNHSWLQSARSSQRSLAHSVHTLSLALIFVTNHIGYCRRAVTILGAHMDFINLNSSKAGRAPGADDDGSGSCQSYGGIPSSNGRRIHPLPRLSCTGKGLDFMGVMRCNL